LDDSSLLAGRKLDGLAVSADLSDFGAFLKSTMRTKFARRERNYGILRAVFSHEA
jgi:hypothetical protein